MHFAASRTEAKRAVAARQPVLWINDAPRKPVTAEQLAAIATAQLRLDRFAPLLVTTFPELAEDAGRVRSPLYDGTALAKALELDAGTALLIKGDHDLPIGGSVKARGGANAVLEAKG
jgi:D-serine dehydratase